jgi:uncharacterized membrane protein
MTHTKADRTPVARNAAEPEWKTAFKKAKQEAENELQEIHREAANRARALLRRAS